MRLVYYAMGGGLGHLVRARAFLHTLEYSGQVSVVTSCELASRYLPGLEVSLAPPALDRNPAAFRNWLWAQLEHTGADQLCVDTFPAGILGELDSVPPGIRLWHVARRLRWENYAQLLPDSALRFERTYYVEPLHPDQHTFLERHSGSMSRLELRDPPIVQTASPIVEPYWLVVHSGPRHEVSELVDHALEMRALEQAHAAIYVATQCAFSHPEVRTLEAFPAEPHFAGAERVVTAAGFNVLRQTRAQREKQTIVPMPRRFDDQFERARRARSS